MKQVSNFAILTALLLSSCANDDLLLENTTTGNGVICISPSVSTSSRGQAIDDLTSFKSSEMGFDLFAYIGSDIFMGSTNDGVEFTCNKGAWNYVNQGEMRFWHEAENQTINFYAVSPSKEKTPEGVSLSRQIRSGINEGGHYSESNDQWLTYTVPTDCSKQIDLMYAKTTASSSSESIRNGVQLEFKHALSQILFKAKTTDENIEAVITGLKVKPLHTQGTFSISKDSWVKSQGNTNITYAVSIPAQGIIVKSTGTTINSSDNALLLIPQQLANELFNSKVEFVITCTLKHKRSGGDYILFEDKEITVPAATTNISNWECGKKYTYTLSFSENLANPVKVNGTNVDTWNEENSDIKNWNTTNISGLAYHLENQEFIISTPKDLKTLAHLVNSGATYTVSNQQDRTLKSFAEATYSQINDIDIDNEPDITRYSPDGNTEWGIGNFDPIGRTKDFPFKGIYKGNGYFINDIYFVMKDGAKPVNIALFGMIQSATIQDLTIHCRIKSYEQTAAFVGEDLGNSTINNCVAKGIDRTIDIDLINTDHIVALDYNCGGIIAKCRNTTIEHCSNYCNLVGAERMTSNIDYTGINVGGIAGSTAKNTDTKIIACVNYGTIIAAYYNGGILGKANGKTDIMGCANFGNVYLVESDAATTGCGGISSDFLGRCISCYNWGEVSASGSTSALQSTRTFASRNTSNDKNSIGAIIGSKMDDNTEVISCYYRYFEYDEYNGGIGGWEYNNTTALNNMNNALKDAGCNYRYTIQWIDYVNDYLMIPVK